MFLWSVSTSGFQGQVRLGDGFLCIHPVGLPSLHSSYCLSIHCEGLKYIISDFVNSEHSPKKMVCPSLFLDILQQVIKLQFNLHMEFLVQ